MAAHHAVMSGRECGREQLMERKTPAVMSLVRMFFKSSRAELDLSKARSSAAVGHIYFILTPNLSRDGSIAPRITVLVSPVGRPHWSRLKYLNDYMMVWFEISF